MVLPPRGEREQKWLFDQAVIQNDNSVNNKCPFQHALSVPLGTVLLLHFGKSS